MKPKNKKTKATKAKTFKEAVEATPDIANCYQSGLKGLGAYSNKIELTDNRECSGSIDIDACTTTLYPRLNRWDYALCYESKVYFVEVHSANTGEISTVLRKFQWLKDWLNEHAPEINKLKAPKPYYWVQTSGFNIPKQSPQYRQVVKAGLRPIAKLVL